MDRITKHELEQIVLNGIAADVFIAERAYSMFKVIGQNGNIIDNTNYKDFFKLTQEALKDRFLLAMARLFDKPSSKNKTRCILGLIDLIKKNSSRLPEILERTNLAAAMRIASFDENSISMIYQKNIGDKIALMIANHFEGLFNREDIVKLSEKLKEIRDTRLAHNDLIVSTKIDLNETLDEIKKFIDLLLKNNPNILELLNTPDDCIMHRHPVMDLVRPELFLSKLCNQTFGQYAYAQIKKARGLNKKILNPIDKKRKSILDFCYVVQGQQSIPATLWLNEQEYKQEECGLVRIDHMRDMYALFHEPQVEIKFNGIYSDESANDVSLSSVAVGLTPKTILNFNKDGYSVYCKEYKHYWEWVNQRNEARYDNTISHGKNYDAKNMMHVFRLLNMAEEIARESRVNVRRTDRKWLLRIRAGEFLYEDLVQQAEEKIQLVDELFKKSDLPDAPDSSLAESILIKIREGFY